jgi:PAS domain S-box-containing protein
MNDMHKDVDTDEPVELFKKALEATADGVVITDINGSIIWVNNAYESLTGYTLAEVKGKNLRLLKSGKQDPSFYRELWDTISAGRVWHGELWNKRKDSELYLEEQSITPVKDDNGDIVRFIAIKRNITNQYKLQNQLSKAQRIEAIAKLTAGVAHNFNNKLASILGYVELSLEEAEQYSNEDLTDYLQEITIAGKLARDLVRQMMAFSRNDVNDIQSVDLVDIIKNTIKIISSTLPSSIKTISQLKETPAIHGDPIMLHQMLVSLVVNSSDAMDGDGVITFGLDTAVIENEICNSCNETVNGEYVVLSVSDTGKGIKASDIDNIFIPFYTTHEFEGGTGMGLSAFHGMLHDQKGHVVVESVVGEYTTFKLYFPICVDTNDVQTTGVSNSSSLDPNSTCILIVDDEEPVANVLAEILRHYNYEVVVETNSKSALKLYSNNPNKFDLILTDKDMPYIDGFEFSNSIFEINKEVPIILMTGHDIVLLNYNSNNIKMTLTKPFETTELIKAIKNIL